MRTLRRLAAVALAAAAGLTCTDGTGPAHRGSASLALHPLLAPEAAAAFSSLEQLGLAVNNVRVVLKRTDGRAVLDTIVLIPSGVEEVTLSLPVVTEVVDEEFAALLELRNESLVLFRGTQQVRSGQGRSPASIATPYVGPGATVKRLELAPADTAISTSSTLQLRAKGFTAENVHVTPILLLWAVNDTTLGAVSDAGVLTPSGKRGTVTVTTRTPTGITAAVNVSLVPTAARVILAEGANQTAKAGEPLPLPIKLQVLATDGQPSAGVQVALRAISGGGSITPAQATTDGNGRILANVVLGRSAGSQSFGARIVGTEIEGIFDFVAEPAPAAGLAIALGDGQEYLVGEPAPAPLVVKVTNSFGELAPGAMVQWAIASGGGALASQESIAGDDGHARMTYTFGQVPGEVKVTAKLPNTEIEAAFTLRGRAGPAASATATNGTEFTGVAGSMMEPPLPALVVRDRFGNGVPDVPVVISVVTDTGYQDIGLVGTDATGQAVMPAVELPPIAGRMLVAARIEGLAPVNFNITIEAAVPARFSVLPSTFTPVPGDVVQVEAFLEDAHGNRAREAGRSVKWTSTNGGSFSATVSATDAEGVARVSFTPATTGGVAHELRATDAADSTITGAATVTTASGNGAYRVTASTTQPLQGSNVTVWAQLVDDAGVAVPEGGRTVKWSASNGATLSISSSLTDASGSASVVVTTANSAGVTHVIEARDAGNAATFGTVAVTTRAPQLPATVTMVSGNGQRGTVNTALPQPLEVEVRDEQGQPIQGTTVSWSSSGGSLGGTGTTSAQSVTNAAGRAQMAYTLPTFAGTASVSAQVAGLTAVSFTATSDAGAPAKLVLARSPSASTTSGQPFATQPIVWVADAFGNASPAGAGRSVKVDVESAGHTITGNVAVADTNGHATFTSLTPSGPAASVTLAFSTDPALTIVRATVDIVAAANTLSARDSTTFSVLAGEYFGTSRPAVRVADGSGAPIPGVSVTFTQVIGGVTGDAWTVTSDTLGIAALPEVPAPTKAGAVTYVATAVSTTGSVEFAVNVMANAIGLVEILGGNFQGVPEGGTLPKPIEVLATDYYGNPVVGAPVTWSLWTGAGTFASADTITGPDGRAMATLTVTSAGAATVAVEAGATAARVVSRMMPRELKSLSYSTVQRNGRSVRVYRRATSASKFQAARQVTAGNGTAAYEGGYAVGIVSAVGIPSGADLTWIGDADSVAGADDWARAANWRTPAGDVAQAGPGTGTTVYIPVTYYSQVPRLAANAVVGTVLSENGAQVELQDFRLEVTTGGVRTLLNDGYAWFSSSTASNGGVVIISGPAGQSLHGIFPNLVVNADVRLTGSLQTDYHMTVNGEMNLAGQSAYVGGDFRVDGPSAGLVLTDSAWAQLYVEGSATFEGRDVGTAWMRGYMVFAGDLTVNATHSQRAYRAAGPDLLTELVGTTSQAVNGTATWGTTLDVPVSAFSSLLVSQTNGMSVTFATAPAITGDVWVYTPSNLVFPAGTPTLALTGDLYHEAGATITNVQTLELNGDGRTVDAYGTLPPDVVVNGSYRTWGGMNVAQDLRVPGTLTVLGDSVNVGRDLTVAGPAAALEMNGTGTYAVVSGLAHFDGIASTVAQYGTLELRGDLRVDATNGTSSPAFRPTGGSFTTLFSGPGNQRVFGAGAWSVTDPGGNAFGHLAVKKPAGTTLMLGDIEYASMPDAVLGNLEVSSGTLAMYDTSAVLGVAGDISSLAAGDMSGVPALETSGAPGARQWPQISGAWPKQFWLGAGHTVTLGRPETANGDVYVFGAIVLAKQVLTVNAGFQTVAGTGRIVLREPESMLVVNGAAMFSGANAAAQEDFIAGTMAFRDSVTVDAARFRPFFAADTGARVRFFGTEQVVRMTASPDDVNSPQLGTVTVDTGASVLLQGSVYTPFALHQKGYLTVDSASVLTVGHPQTSSGLIVLYDKSSTERRITDISGEIRLYGACRTEPETGATLFGNYQCPAARVVSAREAAPVIESPR